jgi:arylsulfatase A-like enzyme
MLMTGRSLFRIGGNSGESIPPEHTTLPEYFKANGYRTHHIGKWHQDRESFRRSFGGGDRIFGFTPGWYVQYGGHWNVAVHDFDPSGSYPADAGYLLGDDKETKHPLIPGLGGVHSSEMFSDAAVDFILDRPDQEDEPFFLYLAYVAPHDPRQSPEAYESGYEPQRMALPANFMERHPFDNGEFAVRDELLEAWPRRPHSIRRHLADYYACIEHLDHNIGRVLDALEQKGLKDDTIVVFASDNGLGIGSHGLMGKQNLYEHSIRVPLILAGPQIPHGQRRDQLCYLYDLFPTLCDAAGIPIPASVEGESFAGAIVDASARTRETLYFAYRGAQRAVREQNHKLIEYAGKGGCFTQLFDLGTDPCETENKASDPGYRQALDTLKHALATCRRTAGDTRTKEAPFWDAYMDRKESL